MTSPSIANAISTLTMSSREIAKLTGKQHRNVMRDATNMLTELYDVRDTLKFEHIYSDTMNRKQTELLLPKRETLILVSGYSVELRARIIDRWMELEAGALKKVHEATAPTSSGLLISSVEELAELIGSVVTRILNQTTATGSSLVSCPDTFSPFFPITHRTALRAFLFVDGQAGACRCAVAAIARREGLDL